jgi:hypothetical protein
MSSSNRQNDDIVESVTLAGLDVHVAEMEAKGYVCLGAWRWPGSLVQLHWRPETTDQPSSARSPDLDAILEGVQAADERAKAHAQGRANADARGGVNAEFDRPPRLDVRLQSLLLLIRHTAPEEMSGHEALAAFVSRDKKGQPTIDLQRPFRQWRRLLVFAYERGYAVFGESPYVDIRELRPRIERQIKETAVALITAGAPVRGISNDAVPLVAFCVLHNKIPLGMAASESPVSHGRMNDAVLAIADELAAMPESERAAFLDLYRLSVLLGVAQRYAEELSLSTISTG